MRPSDPFTPGRTSHVYFTHRDVQDELVKHPKDWMIKTAGGSFAPSL